jgi:hypothetical protein
MNQLLLYNTSLTDLNFYQKIIFDIKSIHTLSLSFIEKFEFNYNFMPAKVETNINKILKNNSLKKFIRNYYQFYNLFDINIYYLNYNKKRKIEVIEI